MGAVDRRGNTGFLSRHIGPAALSLLACGVACWVAFAASPAPLLPTASAAALDEEEPNDSTADADARTLRITESGNVNGGIAPVGDRDYFRVELSAPKRVTFETRDSGGAGCAGGIDTVIRLFNSGGAQIAGDDESGIASCSLLTRALAAGTYYIQVEDWNNNHTIPAYQLLTSIDATQCADGADNDSDLATDHPSDPDCSSPTDDFEGPAEEEPNNSTADADSQSLRITGNGGVEGAISPLGDRDYFRVELSSPKRVTFETRDGTGTGCATNIGTTVRLFNSGGGQIASDNSSGFNNCSLLTTPLDSGTYYIQVEESGNNATIDAYQLLTTMVDTQCADGVDNDGDGQTDHPGDFGCSSPADDTEAPSSQCSDGADNDSDGQTDHPSDPGCSSPNDDREAPTEEEPNDTTGEADARSLRVTGSGAIAGAISPLGDRDYFRVELTTPKRVTFETRDGTGTGCATTIATTVRLFNSGGGQIATDNTSGINNCSLLTRVLDPGIYYIQIEESGNNATIPSYQLLTTVADTQCSDGIDNDSNGHTDHPSDPGCSSATDDFEAPDEEEPNNSTADADARSLRITGSGGLGGSISPVGDKDFFRVELSAPKRVTFETRDGTGTGCAGGIDTEVRLFNSGGAPMASDDDSGISSCSLLTRGLEPGTYYIQVEDFQNNGTIAAYQLLTTMADPQCSDGVDNDSDGQTDHPNDFGCSSPADDTEAPNSQCSDGSDNDGDGETDHPGDPECSSPNDDSEAASEEEPNDTTTQADARALRITEGGAWDGSISPVGDKDFFRVELSAPKRVTFETRDGTGTGCASGVDTVIRLHDTSGEIVEDDQSGTGNCSLITRVLVPGTYYIQVEDFQNNGTIAAYQLRTTIADTQCTDGIDNDADGQTDHPNDFGCSSPADDTEFPNSQCADGADNDSDGNTDHPSDPGCSSPNDDSEGPTEEEPNDTTAQADARSLRITESGSWGGSISPVGDKDFFRLELATPKRVTFETRDGMGTGCAGINTVIRLYADAGFEFANDNDSGIDSCSLLGPMGLPAGTYYIQVEDFQNNDTISAYQLLATFESIACSDGIDNDSDGLSDYPDDPECFSPLDTEHSECSDGLDNDGDGQTDHPADPHCSSPSDDNEWPIECEDGFDNDGDGHTDHPSDPDCSSPSDPSEWPAACANGFDDDGDGQTDHPSDPDCSSRSDETEWPPACANGFDDDGDGQTDHPNDSDCSSPADQTEWPAQCTDGFDNDGDTHIDHPSDPECSSPSDETESPQCSDFIDNDGDSNTDHPADLGCSSPADDTEAPNPQCSDGQDNDSDGQTDRTDDPGCSSRRDDQELEDADGDGLDRLVDNCPDGSNPDQADANGDGQGDVCDDSDGDGVFDDTDNCRTDPNPGQANGDGDGQGDACDPDDDGDGVPDGSDNCPNAANPGQGNIDGDVQGDACDSDDDGDGVGDGSDNCPRSAGPASNGGCPVTTPDPQPTPSGPDPLPGGGSPEPPTVGGNPLPPPGGGSSEFSRSLTIGYSAKSDSFKGKLSSEETACAADQKVTVLEKVKGRDPKVGSDMTSAMGGYAVKERRPDGRYYAIVAETTLPGTGICLAGSSRAIKVG